MTDAGTGAPRSLRSRVLRIGLLGIVEAGGAVLAGATVAGFLEHAWWRFGLFAHFRVQYLLGLALVTAVLVLARRRWSAVLFATFAAVNLALVAPLYFGADAPPPDSAPRLRLGLLNVLTPSAHYGEVLAMVRERDPDLLLLEETDERWLAALAPLAERYPHVVSNPGSFAKGIALYSKLPFEYAEIVRLGSAGLPSVVARFRVEGEPVTLIGTHPAPPRWDRGARYRDEQLAAVARLAASIEGRVIVLGDLNTSPWTSCFRRLLADGGLRNSARGHGVQPTWPTSRELLPLRVPIDHCLLGPGFAVVSTEVGEWVGSDHFPFHVTLALTDE